MAAIAPPGSRICVRCGRVVAPDRKLYCDRCGLPFRDLGPGEAPVREQQWVRMGPPRDAVISALLIGWFPFAIGLQMVVGGLLGWDPSAPGASPVVESLKFLVMAIAYFGPFFAGIVLGWRAIRSRPGPGWFVLGLLGLAGNAAIVAISVLFVIGEVANPH